MSRDGNLMLGLAGATTLGAMMLHHRLSEGRPRHETDEEPPPRRPPGVPNRPEEAPSSPPKKVKLLSPVSRRFDFLFRKHGRVLPAAFLRALAQRESSMNPKEKTGPAWGLLQVVEVVRRDYNKRHGTRFSRNDLLDPDVNIRIASDLLRTIAASYGRNHSGVSNLIMDWSNPRFVELLVAGWNAGWSERAGLGRVAGYLEDRGRTEITIGDIFANARAAGAVRFLSEPARLKWSKSVARLYMSERLRDQLIRRRS